MTQQDDYYYEIQLTNKQLVFYFLAGALGLVLAFLVGVMVGRGVDNAPSEAQATQPLSEERIVGEEPVKPPTSEPSVEELTYARRLETDRPEDSLERSRPARPTSAAAAAPTPEARATATPAAKATPTPAPSATPTPAPKATATPAPKATPTPAPRAAATPRPPATPKATPAARATPPAPAGTFSIQVGAFSSREAADSIVARLRGKGYDAYLVTPSEGLFNVRVGRYAGRADAERIQARLRDEEKFKPFIVRN